MSSSAPGENVCAVRLPGKVWPAHSLNPLIFLRPITLASEISLTSSERGVGGFSGFNHTSMQVPLSNLHCLSQAPAFCQLCIDYHPVPAVCCDSLISAPIPELSLGLRLASWEVTKQPEGNWGFLHEKSIDLERRWYYATLWKQRGVHGLWKTEESGGFLKVCYSWLCSLQTLNWNLHEWVV